MAQLLYLHIFNLCRKFGSNLQNGVSGSFVNNSKFNQPLGDTSRPTLAAFGHLPGAPATASSCFALASSPACRHHVARPTL
jgi:hypothetical protein